MEIVTVLTTHNRPELLEQSIRDILREAATLGPLLIVDDQSDDPRTLEILGDIQSSNPEDAVRVITNVRTTMQVDAHRHLGRCALFAFNQVFELYPETTHVLKCDDDIVTTDGAWREIVAAWEAAEADGHQLVASTGILTINECVTFESPKYRLLRSPCAAACLYLRRPLYDLAHGFLHPAEVVVGGWDWSLGEVWRRVFPNHKVACTNPSYVYHTGINGCHTSGQDFNKDFCGDLTGIIVR